MSTQFYATLRDGGMGTPGYARVQRCCVGEAICPLTIQARLQISALGPYGAPISASKLRYCRVWIVLEKCLFYHEGIQRVRGRLKLRQTAQVDISPASRRVAQLTIQHAFPKSASLTSIFCLDSQVARRSARDAGQSWIKFRYRGPNKKKLRVAGRTALPRTYGGNRAEATADAPPSQPSPAHPPGEVGEHHRPRERGG